MEGQEGQHRSGDALDKALALFKSVIQVFDLQDFDDRPCLYEFQVYVYRMQASQIGSTLIDAHLVRGAVCRDCAVESPKSLRPYPRKPQFLALAGRKPNDAVERAKTEQGGRDKH